MMTVNESMLDAAYAGDLPALTVCLESGASVHYQGGFWMRSALHWAVIKGHLDMISFLLAQGCHKGQVDSTGMTAAQWAKLKGNGPDKILLDIKENKNITL